MTDVIEWFEESPLDDYHVNDDGERVTIDVTTNQSIANLRRVLKPEFDFQVGPAKMDDEVHTVVTPNNRYF